MNQRKIQKKYVSNPENLPEIEQFFIKTFKDLNLTEKKYNSLILALSEASSNAIKHGNKNDPEKFVDILVKIDEEKIEVKIKDEGKGFDPSSVPDPTQPQNLLKESGRGLFIIKSFVDEFYYEFSPEGTIANLVVYRNN